MEMENIIRSNNWKFHRGSWHTTMRLVRKAPKGFEEKTLEWELGPKTEKNNENNSLWFDDGSVHFDSWEWGRRLVVLQSQNAKLWELLARALHVIRILFPCLFPQKLSILAIRSLSFPSVGKTLQIDNGPNFLIELARALHVPNMSIYHLFNVSAILYTPMTLYWYDNAVYI